MHNLSQMYGHVIILFEWPLSQNCLDAQSLMTKLFDTYQFFPVLFMFQVPCFLLMRWPLL